MLNGEWKMDCRVTVEAAVSVYDVETVDEAVSIAISKTGEMLNPDLSYIDISKTTESCPDCGEEHEPGFVAADEGLVGLDLEMTVFGVEGEEHAARVARKEVGQQLEDVPLAVGEVAVVEDEDSDGADTDSDSLPEPDSADDDGLPDWDEISEE